MMAHHSAMVADDGSHHNAMVADAGNHHNAMMANAGSHHSAMMANAGSHHSAMVAASRSRLPVSQHVCWGAKGDSRSWRRHSDTITHIWRGCKSGFNFNPNRCLRIKKENNPSCHAKKHADAFQFSTFYCHNNTQDQSHIINYHIWQKSQKGQLVEFT